MKNILKIIIVILITFIGNFVFAADISLYTNQTNIKTGDEFTIDVLVHTKEKLNAVEGKLIFPKNDLEIKEIRDGNSIINFWVEKPTNNDGIISFSGITPGGFKGNNEKVFSVVFKAKNMNEIMFSLSNISLLLADGEGTNATENIFNISLSIEKGEDNNLLQILTDSEPPEYFNPIITSDPNIFDGKNFIAFATQDKDSGLSHFEIKEGWISFYKKAESPYLLKNQNLNKKIYIKAIDLNGNERDVVINALNPEPWYKQFAIFGLLLIAIIIFLIKRIHAKIF